MELENKPVELSKGHVISSQIGSSPLQDPEYWQNLLRKNSLLKKLNASKGLLRHIKKPMGYSISRLLYGKSIEYVIRQKGK